MYEKGATEHEAALFGLELSEIPPEEIDVWGENWDSFILFSSLSTQWRVGMGGAIGLDYNTIPIAASLLGYKKKKLQNMFSDIQVMENEALITMGENAEDGNDS